MLNKSFLLLVLITVTIAVTACSTTVITPKKTLASVVFPKHPGTIKMVDMYDKTTELIPIDEVPKWKQFIYYDNDGGIVDNIQDAVKAIPIVEERMTPTLNGKIVSPDKADFIKIELFGADGTFLKVQVIPQRHK